MLSARKHVKICEALERKLGTSYIWFQPKTNVGDP